MTSGAECNPNVPIPSSGAGLVDLCESDGGASMRVENTSDLVLEVRFAGHAEPIPSVVKSLTDQVRERVVTVSCKPGSCILPPGASVQLSGLTSRDLTFATVVEDSLSWVFAAGITKEVEGHLTPQAQRKPRQIVACVEGVDSILDSQNPEERLLRTLKNAPGCKKLLTEALGTEDAAKRESVARDVVKKLRGFAGDSLWDGLLVAFKTGVRAVHG